MSEEGGRCEIVWRRKKKEEEEGEEQKLKIKRRGGRVAREKKTGEELNGRRGVADDEPISMRVLNNLKFKALKNYIS